LDACLGLKGVVLMQEGAEEAGEKVEGTPLEAAPSSLVQGLAVSRG
jgi:hypothetical protein